MLSSSPEMKSLIKKLSDPKPDPCRKYKAGDMVSPCFWNDRQPAAYYISEVSGHFTPEDGVYEVDNDEMPDATVLVRYKDKVISMQACQLELMTPVEEREPYGVSENLHGWIVFKDTPGNVVANFNNTHPHAKASAEAERDRLNAEYRKEQK